MVGRNSHQFIRYSYPASLLISVTLWPNTLTIYISSFRMVVDVGEWDNSRVINAPGQSGDPDSPHYDDLAEAWAMGGYGPLLYTLAAVDDAAKLKIYLRPKCVTAQHQ